MSVSIWAEVKHVNAADRPAVDMHSTWAADWRHPHSCRQDLYVRDSCVVCLLLWQNPSLRDTDRAD